MSRSNELNLFRIAGQFSRCQRRENYWRDDEEVDERGDQATVHVRGERLHDLDTYARVRENQRASSRLGSWC